jgi:hypothetical protein
MRKEASMVLSILAMASALCASQAQSAPTPTVGMGRPPIAPPVVAAPVPSDETRWTPPFEVTVVGPDATRPGESLRLRLEIRRAVIDETPMRISIELPPGVTLESGRTEEDVISVEPTIVHEVDLRIGPEVPAQDVVFTVEQKGDGWGGRAEKIYSFGRVQARALQAPLRLDAPARMPNGGVVRPVKVGR